MRGWAPLIVLPVSVLLLSPHELPRWLFMWMLSFAIYAGCKWLTWRRTAVSAPWWRHAAYLLAWPGLDAKSFLSLRPPTHERPVLSEWLIAGAKLLTGVALFWGASRLAPERHAVLLGWLGMIGVVLILHFGLFHLLSCAWRRFGVAAAPLMNNPAKSVRVSEFWGRRWNTAFRDLTHRFLFRPLTERLGPRGALAAGFLFSGLVHDLVISVPARGGYGGPTLFFAVQGVALLGERSRIGEAAGLGRGWRGWLFTMLVLILPAYLLFHPPFVENIIVPFMRALGAL